MGLRYAQTQHVQEGSDAEARTRSWGRTSRRLEPFRNPGCFGHNLAYSPEIAPPAADEQTRARFYRQQSVTTASGERRPEKHPTNLGLFHSQAPQWMAFPALIPSLQSELLLGDFHLLG